MSRGRSRWLWSAACALIVAIAGTAAVRSSQGVEIGSLLVPGTQLVYERDGVQMPWTIDSVVPFTATGMSRCVRIRLRTSPSQATPELRAQCTDSTRLFNWDERLGPARPARPLQGGMNMEMRQTNGTLVRFEASAPTVERVRVE